MKNSVYFELPEIITRLCDTHNIRPFSHYVNRSPWKAKESLEKDFLNKQGIYCFWWSGSHEFLIKSAVNAESMRISFTKNDSLQLPHRMLPMYVGTTSKAIEKKGKSLTGRLMDRFINFPKVMARSSFKLSEHRTGFCGNIELFGYKEKIKKIIISRERKPHLTLEEAEPLQHKYWDTVSAISETYFDLLHKNYSISFVECDDIDAFYSEALAIGHLQPCLNLS